MSVVIVIIVRKFTPNSKDVTDIFLHRVFFFQKHIKVLKIVEKIMSNVYLIKYKVCIEQIIIIKIYCVIQCFV